MKSAIWVLALPLSLLAVGELRAQPLPYPAPGAYVYGGGYGGSGGGIGFVYSRRHLSIAGFLGGFGASRYSAGGVYLDAPYLQPPAPPTIILNNQITL
ncbi:MAG TPA: hypothetical protein VEL76_17140, partial [Gemmataceae bacterium]|nr:hypothetical protein [Gemmataceae bacterium]